jgi:hypothetical protein
MRNKGSKDLGFYNKWECSVNNIKNDSNIPQQIIFLNVNNIILVNLK